METNTVYRNDEQVRIQDYYPGRKLTIFYSCFKQMEVFLIKANI